MMINPLLMVKPEPFPLSSRYYGFETNTFTANDGTILTYLRRRWVVQPGQMEVFTEHMVKDGERLDRITAMYFSDPELFWRICDANNTLNPNELTETAGRMLRITLPQGISGLGNV